MAKRPLKLHLAEPAAFSESDWAVFRTYALISDITMAQVATRYGVTPQKAGRVYKAVLAEIRTRAERHGSAEDLQLLQKNPRRSGKTAEAWAKLIRKYQNYPLPSVKRHQPPRFWFPPDLAAKLEAAGYTNLEKIIIAMNRFGFGWYKRARPAIETLAVAGMGGVREKQIREWLMAHEKELGAQISQAPLTPRAAKTQIIRRESLSVDPVPLERFAPPISLDGNNGKNRTPAARSVFRNDLEAIEHCISSQTGSTLRNYRREAERFFLWAVLEQRKPFSSLSTQDCVLYKSWLRQPAPVDRWIGPAMPRWHKDWRPFQKPLSDQAINQVCATLSAVMNQLVKQRYLITNPWVWVQESADR